MPDEVVTFDPEQMKKKLAGIVHASIVGLMPEEALMPFIRAAIAEFQMKELPNLVKEAMRVHCAKQIAAHLNSPEFAAQWSLDNAAMPGEAVKEIVRQLAPDLMQAQWGGIIQQAVNDMRSHLQRGY